VSIGFTPLTFSAPIVNEELDELLATGEAGGVGDASGEPLGVGEGSGDADGEGDEEGCVEGDGVGVDAGACTVMVTLLLV
jgi:hypothetical protein